MTSKPVLSVTFFTALNLGVSFLNQLVLAYLFGASVQMDAFLAAGALPLTVLGLAINDLGFLLVPLLMRYEDQGERREIISRLFSLMTLLGLGIMVLGLAGHRWLIQLTTASTIPPRTLALAVSLAPLIWVIVGLECLSGFLTGLHHFYRKFTVLTFVRILPFLGMVAGGLLGASRSGIKAVVLGWLAGSLLKNLILLRGAWERGSFRFQWGFRHPAIWAFSASVFPLAVSLLPFILLPVIDVYWASRLPEGSISYLGYSTRIVIAITGIGVQGISVVLFPALSEDIARRRFEEFRSKVSAGLKVVILVLIPIAVLMSVLRRPLLALLFQRGSFDSRTTLAVARVLPWYLAGMVSMGAMNIVSRAFYALTDYKTPARLGLLSLSLYAILSGILSRYFSYEGIGMAYAVYWLFTSLLQGHWLGLAMGRALTRDTFVFVGKVLACSSVTGLLTTWGFERVSNNLDSLMGMILCGLCGGLLFGSLTCCVFGVMPLRRLISGETLKEGAECLERLAD